MRFFFLRDQIKNQKAKFKNQKWDLARCAPSQAGDTTSGAAPTSPWAEGGTSFLIFAF
jgi:hypothetical protein